MRYKQHTVSKLEAQATKLKTLQRAIKNSDMTGQQAIEFLEQIIKEINFVVERLELESNE
jgi:hypothetical protein